MVVEHHLRCSLADCRLDLTHHVRPPHCDRVGKCRSGRHVVIIATRTILGKSYARSTKTQGIRPRSRTLTAVQDAMLEVCYVSCYSCAHE